MSKAPDLEQDQGLCDAAHEHEIRSVHMLGVRIDDMPVDTFLSRLVQIVLSGRRAVVSYANIHTMNLAYELAWLRRFLNSSEINFCDGVGIAWGARLLGARILHRYTYADWFPLFCGRCAQHGLSLFFLGARPGVADQAAARLTNQFPGLRIVGTCHGFFDKTAGSSENASVIDQINALQPDILVVCFGMPAQEHWLLENWEHIEARLALPAGAALDYMAGELWRAPAWMTDNGLEWLGRLLAEPKRLWKRYLVGNPLFMAHVLRERWHPHRWD